MTEPKRIEAQIPDTATFFLAFPAPQKDLIDIAENPTEMVIVDGKNETKVIRGDFFRYPLGTMSNLICEITYGHDAAWTSRHLKQKYPYLEEDSMIAFFLFKKVKTTDNKD
ncbi:MAG TPA: hypothetical protein DCR40_10085 [Prolixibacteraceae bacterium]|uniref:ASCH domain-containing protein n=1 Tax=candidate division WS6 bacterium GW2011_GWF1_36_8 TaxID=1619098 RepID=A0A0G0HV25_9BACT|nr:MAG: hypothetical protein US29_C0034G0003 [candidate division WS6 bacterium GW2011_GWF1_36_8]KKQ19327.1 MAG: hypothetical protein US34_C0023G0001 [Candidatus Nomurabacteria bacterium GW2011_GWC2_36_9]HAQ19563.1 hypothetical protein [Prolixibacteraceae bacterium]